MTGTDPWPPAEALAEEAPESRKAPADLPGTGRRASLVAPTCLGDSSGDHRAGGRPPTAARSGVGNDMDKTIWLQKLSLINKHDRVHQLWGLHAVPSGSRETPHLGAARAQARWQSVL